MQGTAHPSRRERNGKRQWVIHGAKHNPALPGRQLDNGHSETECWKQLWEQLSEPVCAYLHGLLQSQEERSSTMAKPRIYVTRRLPAAGLDRILAETEATVWEGELPPSGDEILRQVAGCDGLV